MRHYYHVKWYHYVPVPRVGCRHRRRELYYYLRGGLREYVSIVGDIPRPTAPSHGLEHRSQPRAACRRDAAFHPMQSGQTYEDLAQRYNISNNQTNSCNLTAGSSCRYLWAPAYLKTERLKFVGAGNICDGISCYIGHWLTEIISRRACREILSAAENLQKICLSGHLPTYLRKLFVKLPDRQILLRRPMVDNVLLPLLFRFTPPLSRASPHALTAVSRISRHLLPATIRCPGRK